MYPLVRFLGYSDSSYTVRESVPFKVGSQDMVGKADWVLWAKDFRSGQLKPRVIVEAKAPDVALHEDVKAQARSYAFALNAPYYLLANARQLLLFKRGVESDECILACDVTELASRWPVLLAHIGPH